MFSSSNNQQQNCNGEENPCNAIVEERMTMFKEFSQIFVPYTCCYLFGNLGVNMFLFAAVLTLMFFCRSQHLETVNKQRIEKLRKAGQELFTRSSEKSSNRMESVEWLNLILTRQWPVLEKFIQKTHIWATECCEKQFGILLDKMDLGSRPVKLQSVKCRIKKDHSREKLIIDVDLDYRSNSHVQILFKGIAAGIKDLHVRGTVGFEIWDLSTSEPLFESVNFYFHHNPHIEFRFTNFINFALQLFDFLDLVEVATVKKYIKSYIEEFMVYPNTICIAQRKP